MILGLYKHYKEHWYIALFSWAWESSNNQPRVRKVIYLSLHNLFHFKFREVVNLRERGEFMEALQLWGAPQPKAPIYRFKRIIPWWQP